MNLRIAWIFFLALSFSSAAPGAPEDNGKDDIPKDPIVVDIPPPAPVGRSYFGMMSYSPIDLLIPSKFGVSIGTEMDQKDSWELEYLGGRISAPVLVEDLGKMSDQRISLMRRSYFGNAGFNLSYGLSYFDFNLHLGDALLSHFSGGAYPSVDMISLKSWGLIFGLGNRWKVSKSVIVGVDWFQWAQPMGPIERKAAFLDYTTNSSDKETVEKAVNFIAAFPRFVFFKLQLGISF